MWCPHCHKNHHFENNSDCPLASSPPKENFSYNKKYLSKNSHFLFTIPSHYKSVAHRQKLYKITEAAIAAQQKLLETLETRRMKKCEHNEKWTWCPNCKPKKSGNDEKQVIGNLRDGKFNMTEDAKQKYNKNNESKCISSHFASFGSGIKDCDSVFPKKNNDFNMTGMAPKEIFKASIIPHPAKTAGSSKVQDCDPGSSEGKNSANITGLTEIKVSESSEKQNVPNMACFAAKNVLPDNTCEKIKPKDFKIISENKNKLNVFNDDNRKSDVILNSKEKMTMNTTAIPHQMKSLSSLNIQVRFPHLSAGSISKILEGQEIIGAVVQIVGYEKLPGPRGNNYLLFISDGISSIDGSTKNLFACMDRKFNCLVTNNELKEFTIIQINRYICYYVQPVCKVIILLDIDVLVHGAEIRKRIGIPIISSIFSVPTASSTGNNAELNSILNNLVRSTRPQPQVYITPQVLRPTQDYFSMQVNRPVAKLALHENRIDEQDEDAKSKCSKNDEMGKEKRECDSVFSKKRFHSDVTDMASNKIFKTSVASHPGNIAGKSKVEDSDSSEGKNTTNITGLTEFKAPESSKKQNASDVPRIVSKKVSFDNTWDKIKPKDFKRISENKNKNKLNVFNDDNRRSDVTLNSKEKMTMNTAAIPGQIKRNFSSLKIQTAIKECPNKNKMGKRLRDHDSFFQKKRFCPNMTGMASNKIMSVTSHPGKSKIKDCNSASSEGKNVANVTNLMSKKTAHKKVPFIQIRKTVETFERKDLSSKSSVKQNVSDKACITSKRKLSDNTCEKMKSNDKIMSENNNSKFNVSKDDTSKSDVTLKTEEKMTIALPGPREESLSKIKSHFESQKPLDIHKAISSGMKQTVVDVPTSKGIQDHNYTQLPWMSKYPEISECDLKCLDESSSHEPDKSDKEKYLNDTIIEFYLKYICTEKLTPEQKRKTYVLSSYFFPKLEKEQRFIEQTGKAPARSIEKTWLKNADMFSKDFILIPINESLHWYLIVICYLSKLPKIPLDGSKTTTTGDIIKEDPIDKAKRPCIFFFDSARDILWDEKLRKAETLKKLLMRLCLSKQGDYTYDFNQLIPRNVRCPKQEDKFSCGIFLLQFAEHFFQKSIDWEVENRPSVCHWFSSAKIASERQRIKKIIQEIVEKKKKLTLSYSLRR